MTYIEMAIIGILLLCCLIGLISGLIKGWIKGLVRCLTIILAIVLAFAFRQVLTNWVCFGINVNGNTLYQTLTGVIRDALSAAGTGTDLDKACNMAWPIVEIMISAAIFFVSLAIFVLLSNIIYGILCIFLKHVKAKHRAVGGLVGFLTGAVVGLCPCSMISGLVPNISKVMALEFNGQSVKSLLKIDDQSETWQKIGVDKYSETWISKPMSYVDNIVFKNTSSIVYQGKTYTLDGQINAIIQSEKLTDSLVSIGTVDFKDSESVKELAETFDELNFKDMSEEEKEFVDGVLSEIIPEEYNITLTADDLAGVDFSYVGDSVETISKMVNGEEVSQSEVDGVVSNLIKSGALEVASQFSVEISSSVDASTKAVLQEAVDSLTVSETSGISETDIAQLKALLGLK